MVLLVPEDGKTEQLQIRVSPSQKRAIRRQAEKAHMTMSEWILARVLPPPQATFHALLEDLAAAEQPGHVFAELLEWLAPLGADAFERAVAEAPSVALSPYWQNYLATVEHAAAMKGAKAPGWTRDIPPLAKPAFGSSLASLRLHLLVNSPAAFVQRNIFIDASVGARV